ncbi:MAG: glycosyltransferase family 4 protein [Chitinophagaceae bacterium]
MDAELCIQSKKIGWGMKVSQISIGRFHHFHLARQLEKREMLEALYTGYPRFKLKDEKGIPSEKIKTFPWLQAPYMMRGRVGLNKWSWLNKEWAWWAHETLDKYAASHIKEQSILIALSGSGLLSGKTTQLKGGKYICDRGSSHIRFQDELLREEYARWKLSFHGVDRRNIKKEEAEYELSDRITVPSEFVRKSFLLKGIPEQKICKVVYGARLDRFSKLADPDHNKFVVLWVGAVSIRKGFMYLLDAFRRLKHPNKELQVVGTVMPEIRQLLTGQNLDRVNFMGVLPNVKLAEMYSKANVFVLPSLEEGLAMVQGEALACGCPVIGSTNSGAEDLITDGIEGFIVPIRSAEAIFQSIQRLADDPALRESMSKAALKRVQSLGGWDTYGQNFSELITQLETA